jgi:DNA-binding MurR/RpiR family transcriptional regulator
MASPQAEMPVASAADVIMERFGSLSPGHQRLAEFILAHPHQAAMMTLEEMSQSTGVSVATANRLAAKLGLKGYPEFKELLRSNLREALRPATNGMDGLRLRGNARQAAWTRSLDEDVRRIQGANGAGMDGAFASACNKLSKARRVFVVGFGSSAFLAQYAVFNLSTLRPGCEALTDSGGFEGASRRLIDATSDDVALQLAFARYSEAGTAVGRQFRAQGVPVVAITDSATSPIAALSDIIFVVPRKSGFVLTGGGAGALALVEALLHGTADAIGHEEVKRRAAHVSRVIGPALVPQASPEG